MPSLSIPKQGSVVRVRNIRGGNLNRVETAIQLRRETIRLAVVKALASMHPKFKFESVTFGFDRTSYTLKADGGLGVTHSRKTPRARQSFHRSA